MKTSQDSLSPPPPPGSSSNFQPSTFNLQLFFLLLLATVIGIRIHLASMPLERDEGEYAYMAQLLLAGTPPYEGAYTMKFPGTHMAYAGILSIFGQTDTAIRIGLLLINLLTAWFVYRIGTLIKSKSMGCWAAACFLILTLSPKLLGLTANCEHFVLLPVAIGCWILTGSLRDTATKGRALYRYLLGGLCLGLAITMKQQAVFFAIALFPLTFRNPPGGTRRRRLQPLAFLGGLAIPILLMVLWMYGVGSMEAFKFWCFDYAVYYGHIWSYAEIWRHFQFTFFPFAKDYVLLLLLTLAGLSLLSRQKDRLAFLFLGLLGIGAVLALIPGWNFRPHYYLYLALPMSLIFGFTATEKIIKPWLAGLALALPLLMAGKTLFLSTPEEAVRILYPHSAFKETRDISQWLASNSKPQDTIGIFGSEPQICFYAKRSSSTPYIYMYPLMEPQPFAPRMQKEFIQQFEKSPPAFLIHLQVPSSWSPYKETHTELFQWMPGYISKNYTHVQEVTIPAFQTAPERKIQVYQLQHLP